jgi:L-serine dehydratase
MSIGSWPRPALDDALTAALRPRRQTANAKQTMISVFELFKIGIGPSSSHTVGPMLAAGRFLHQLDGFASRDIARIEVALYGSLALTGKGHGTQTGVVLGLAGFAPDNIDPDRVSGVVAGIEIAGVALEDGTRIPFRADRNIHLIPEALPAHPNGLRFAAYDAAGDEVVAETYYSIGGGFVVTGQEVAHGAAASTVEEPYPYRSAAQLLGYCQRDGKSIAEIVRANERIQRHDATIDAGLRHIRAAMHACIERGCRSEGELPGGLNVRRRAASMLADLKRRERANTHLPHEIMDWVSVFAIAVNEENAAGGRVVTAPTNGAAGLLPAVLEYYERFCPGADETGTFNFLLTAGAIGGLFKRNASISGAEVGCQGEVGVACSMAAAGLAAALGGTPEQVENAAEIGMEHHLGLTCDPIGGLVQIPCIERNAMGAVTAINAASLGLHGDGRHHVSLDAVIATMRQTGADMGAKYKETSQGGLAVNVVQC